MSAIILMTEADGSYHALGTFTGKRAHARAAEMVEDMRGEVVPGTELQILHVESWRDWWKS